jgi:hypothetical protein
VESGEWEEGLHEVDDGFGDFIFAVDPAVTESFGDHEFNIIMAILFYFEGVGEGRGIIVFIMHPEYSSPDIFHGTADGVPLNTQTAFLDNETVKLHPDRWIQLQELKEGIRGGL